MRRTSWVLICCALLLVAGAAQSATVVRVGLYRNPPKVLAPSNGGPGGIFVDVLESVARDEGFTLTYDEGSFDNQLQRVLDGEIDLMVDVAMTEQRRKVFDLSVPVLQSWNSVYAPQASAIRRIGDLAGKRVAALAGSVQEQNLREALVMLGMQAQVLRFDTYDQAFDAVRRGGADAVVSNPFYGGPTHGGLRDTSILFGDSTFHFVAKKGANTALMQAIDRHLVEMKTDPQSVYFRSFQRLQATQRGEVVPPWVPWAALSLTVFLLLALAWAVAYRRIATRLREAERGQRRLADDLRRQNERLESANNDLQVISSSLSHDLRSPAAAVAAFTGRALELTAQRGDAPEVARLLERSAAAATRIDRMLADLAGLLRVAGQRVHAEDCDVSAIAADVVRDARDANPAYARTEVRIAAGLHARADVRLLRLALENLLGNAMKFSAGTAHPLVEVWQEEQDHGETVTFVRDNGSGFDPAYADKLFQPFSRLHTQAEFPGTGLGLSIASRIVRMHQGRMGARSTVGQGAVFWFSLSSPGLASTNPGPNG
ncbi:sensor histidine kinase [Ramlibacter sp. MMS24-I3-19]|uniref:sensor histidine kinase n=1 Tax=Ramlibacter sp. MMS24-I3-19 TaxID=3416606 RepID=UPI003D02FB7A